MKRLLARLFLMVIALAVFLVAVSIAPLPRPLLRRAAVSSAPWIMGGGESGGRIDRIARRLFGAYLQFAFARHLSSEVARRPGEPDHIHLGRILAVTRDRILNQNQFRHVPRERPALVHGFGFCDQINGVAAAIAANDFRMSQLYSAWNP